MSNLEFTRANDPSVLVFFLSLGVLSAKYLDTGDIVKTGLKIGSVKNGDRLAVVHLLDESNRFTH